MKDGSEPTSARGKRDILRVTVGLITRREVLTGNLESGLQDSMKRFALLYLDEKMRRTFSPPMLVYIDQRASPALSGSFPNIT